jgi:hypothetical protein
MRSNDYNLLVVDRSDALLGEAILWACDASPPVFEVGLILLTDKLVCKDGAPFSRIDCTIQETFLSSG